MEGACQTLTDKPACACDQYPFQKFIAAGIPLSDDFPPSEEFGILKKSVDKRRHGGGLRDDDKDPDEDEDHDDRHEDQIPLRAYESPEVL